MDLSESSAGPQGHSMTAVAWAAACEARRVVELHWFKQWPQGGLTKVEKRRMKKIQRLMTKAQRETCLLQSSLSKRAKLEGAEHPDYTRLRGKD